MSSYPASVPGHVVEAAQACACAHRWCRTLPRVQLAVALLVCGLVVQATCAGQKERSEQHVARHESGAVDEGLDDVATPHAGAEVWRR